MTWTPKVDRLEDRAQATSTFLFLGTLLLSSVRWGVEHCTGRKAGGWYEDADHVELRLLARDAGGETEGVLLNETVPAWVVDIVVEKKLPKFIKVWIEKCTKFLY